MKIYNPFKPHIVKINNELYAVRKFTFCNNWVYYTEALNAYAFEDDLSYIVKYCYFKEYETVQEIYYNLKPSIKIL